MGTHYQGTAAERRALDLYIKLSRAAESVNQRVNRHLQEVQLTVSQFGVLEALHHLGPLTPGQLGEKILRSTGNLTMVIDNLEKRQLVIRTQNPMDRRSTIIELTTAGQALIEDFFPKHVAVVVQEVSVLSPEEQSQLAALCRKLGLQMGA
ncbi:MAG: MarR family transcriptional regulator [Caldilineaceae bacterium]|nr:MarR family transcriptional regulator [Caldilineaceae bacterium]